MRQDFDTTFAWTQRALLIDCDTMADADEDALPRGNTASEEPDLTDETQDFRFLATISYSISRKHTITSS
jgi:hypothetical protein